MVRLHANWFRGQLHLWGEATEPRAHPGASEERQGAGGGAATAQAIASDPLALLSPGELRDRLGDVCDALLVAEAAVGRLTLLVPHCDGRPMASGSASDGGPADLRELPVETLTFAPADAVDVLISLPAGGSAVSAADSFLFWSRAARFVLELLARQRFVPDIHRDGPGQFRGFWRVVVDDQPAAGRLRLLIEAMPPVCRSLGGAPAAQAGELVENFLWSAADALVRRALEGDELAHTLHDRRHEDHAPQTQWLRALVRSDSRVPVNPAEGAEIHAAIRDWLARLSPPSPVQTCRTCLRLEPPDLPTSLSGPEAIALPWRLTLHVQALDDPDWIVDAERLWQDHAADPLILRRPFEEAREQLHADLQRAVRHFPPLARCLESDRTGACELSLDEAYQFLQEAMPMLEHDGLVVWAPRWWRGERPRIGMRLHLHAGDGPGRADGSALSLETLVEYDWRVALGEESLNTAEITALAQSKSPLVQVRGRWVVVQPSDVKAALRFLDRARSGHMTVFEALRQSYLADDLDTGLPLLELRAEGWIDSLLHADRPDARMETTEPPAEFKGVLRPYQLNGLAWFRFLGRHGLGSCLADDMGLGKTIQLISLLLKEREEGASPGPTLLVIPMSLVGNWEREIAKFGPNLRVLVHHGLDRLSGEDFVRRVTEFDVVISTYGLIHRDREFLSRVQWHRLALDEAQNIKNPAAKQSLAIRSLSAVLRVALTGTPVENRLSELWSIMDFINPGYLGGAAEFRRRFAVPIERRHDANCAARLRALIRPFVLRRLKSDPQIAAELPAKMEMKVFCNLTREQAALYEAVVSDMMGQISHAQGITRRGLILATLVKLKQICNHPSLFLADGPARPHRSGKCDRLTEMLEEAVAEGDRALVFTQFRQMGELLQPLLKETLGCEVLLLHGGTDQKARVALVDRFQDPSGDAPVFILSLKAGGFGLNLTAASHVFHFDRWWNPAVEDQATDRAHRIGQSKQVQVHKYVCVGTLEERIDAMISRKRMLAENIVGSGEEWLTELSTDALRELFALSRDAVAEG